ncbi:MAG: FAD:protein FMN transferase [Ruminococcus sp.]|nr:FAD:protein FMN transferase [Ruminococcus sp.]
MTKAYQSQNIFFAFGVLCTLTVYDGNRVYALSKAKARAQEIDRKNRFTDAVAIGYAAQQIKQIFIREGVTEAVIKLGDTVINMGKTRRHGIRNPFSKDPRYFAYLDLGEKSMVTLIASDPQETAFTRRSNIASVTLIGSDTVQLSELCAAVIGYSSDEALALLDGTGIEAILVTKDEQVLTTSGLSQKQQIAA